MTSHEQKRLLYDVTMADYSSPSLGREIRPHVSFSYDVSVFEEDGNTTIDTGEDDLEPKSLFSGRWVGDISTSDASSRGVALVELNENVLELPLQCSDQNHPKRLSLDTDVSSKKFGGPHVESPPKRIHGNRSSQVLSPLSKSPATPLSENSHCSFFSSGSLPGIDDNNTRSGSSQSSFDSGPPIAKRFQIKLRTRVVNRVRAVVCFVGYATVISGARGNRFVLGLKLMGALVLCFLACVSTAKDRPRTRLSEIVSSRKTFLLLIYIVAWTCAVNVAAGVWGDSTLCTENETAARRNPSDETIAQDAPLPETDFHSAVIADLKDAADRQVEIETTYSEIIRVSESIDDKVVQGDAVEFSNAEATSERSLAVAHEYIDREVEIEVISPEVTRVSGFLDDEVAKVDAVELNDAEANSEEIQMEAQEAAYREVEIETISSQITRVSGSIHDELTEGENDVGLIDEEAKSEDPRTEARESADRETKMEATSPEIKSASGSLDVDEAEVNDVESNVAEAVSENIQVEARESKILSHLEEEISEMNTRQNDLPTAADTEVGITARGTALASDPQMLPRRDEKHAINHDGRYDSQTANVKSVSPGSGRESNVLNTGTDLTEPRISYVINEKEAIVVELGNGTVATGIKVDTENSYLAHESTDWEDAFSREASIIATETARESETNGGDEGNELDTYSQKEVTNAVIEDSNFEVNDRNTTDNDRVDPASEGATLQNVDTLEKLHGRRPLPRFVTPFVTKIWMTKDSAKRKQTSRSSNYLFSVPIGQAPPPNRNGDSSAVDKNVPSLSLTVLTGVAKSAVRHCIAFLIGVDGKYKNQVMMDTLSEIWISRFWI